MGARSLGMKHLCRDRSLELRGIAQCLVVQSSYRRSRGTVGQKQAKKFINSLFARSYCNIITSQNGHLDNRWMSGPSIELL